MRQRVPGRETRRASSSTPRPSCGVRCSSISSRYIRENEAARNGSSCNFGGDRRRARRMAANHTAGVDPCVYAHNTRVSESPGQDARAGRHVERQRFADGRKHLGYEVQAGPVPRALQWPTAEQRIELVGAGDLLFDRGKRHQRLRWKESTASHRDQLLTVAPRGP